MIFSTETFCLNPSIPTIELLKKEVKKKKTQILVANKLWDEITGLILSTCELY